MWHILEDTLFNSVFVTGMVVIMMMIIESLNIESRGRLLNSLRGKRFGQVATGALLGMIPGCVGGFATVSLYTHGLLSFGALVAMMIASSGDEAFVMMAMTPEKTVLIFGILLVLSVIVGYLVDFLGIGKKHGVRTCQDGYRIHPDDNGSNDSCENHGEEQGKHHHSHKKWHFSLKRALLSLLVGGYAAALGFGILEHEHVEEINNVSFNILDEQWMNIFFAVLSCVILVMILCGSDHFVEEHLWKHVVVKHLGSIFAWTFGVLLLVNTGLYYFDIRQWVSDNTALMILLAVLVGIIPESGPHLIFVTLYANGIIGLPVLLASCISQDGHASLPLLAEDRKAFLKAKAVNCVVGLVVGYSTWLLM